MKILVANPNSSALVSERIEQSASRKKRPDTRLVMLTNPSGTKNIDCGFADYQSVWSLQRAILKRMEVEAFDAIVLAGFGNVGVFALKEAVDLPVVSISEAAQTIACLLGHRYAVVTMLRQFVPYQEDLVRLYGLDKKCAGVRSIDVNVERCVTDRASTLASLKKELQRILCEEEAEVIVLGCAGLCGYDEALQAELGIPVLDPVTVSVKVAEMMVEGGLTQSKLRKFHAPPQPLEDYLL